MRYALPIILFLALATLIVTAPRIGPWRARRQAHALARDLVQTEGFTASPDIEHEIAAEHAPPFHYGTAHNFEDDLIGTVHDMPVSTGSYTCHYNGETHRYGVALVSLDHDVERVEVRDGPAFATAWVIDAPPQHRIRTGTPAFDERFETYTPDRTDDRMVLAPDAPALLTGVAEPFSMRAEGRRLLLWRSPGWSSPEALEEDVTTAVAVLA
ncbi:hypothetical protein ABH926_007178 [Catenulispora sp. GP43]|uniref:hypothetical protein n=1 Tax=Catenulispora sp. GP43 TaxID=3156263 RepID=UPI00351489FC